MDCFHEQIVITLANEFRRRSGEKVTGGFLSGTSVPLGFENYNWLQHRDDKNFRHEALDGVDIVISLNNPAAVQEMAELAVHHNKPFLCCAYNIGERDYQPLEYAAHYVPTYYYDCAKDNLDTVINNLLDIVKVLPQMPVNGKVHGDV